MTVPVLRSVAELRSHLEPRRRTGIGLVPTMGALHRGHAALITRCASLTGTTVVSVFVNPLQFDDRKDLGSYPRTLPEDVATAAAAGAAAVYAPAVDEMYPAGFESVVSVPITSGGGEGASRPGHFDGVATVVCKLINAVQPEVAVFGEKDRQQLAVIRRMVRDLDMPVRIEAHPTVREEDGLALSSRNARLDPHSRALAPVVHRALMAAAECFRGGERRSGALTEAFTSVLRSVPQAVLDYVEITDPDTMQRVSVVDGSAVASCAVHLGGVRLIDNVDLVP